MNPPDSKKLKALALKLIHKDLKRIARHKVRNSRGFIEPIVPGLFSEELCRYFRVLDAHDRTVGKIEDEQRELLRKKTTAELLDIAQAEKKEPEKK